VKNTVIGVAAVPGAKVVGAGDPVHGSVVVRTAGATAGVIGNAGVADPALGPKRGRKKGLDPVNPGKDGPGHEVKAEKKRNGKRGPGPGTARGPDGPGPEMVQVSRERAEPRERAEQEGMIGAGSRSRMSPRTGLGGMTLVTTHRTTMTMEDTMLMSRLSMMTAKIVNHSPTVARTMSIEIQVLFTVE